MLITVEVKEVDADYTTIYVGTTHEEFVLPTKYLQVKYMSSLGAGRQLTKFDTQWLKQDVSLAAKIRKAASNDGPRGYGESW